MPKRKNSCEIGQADYRNNTPYIFHCNGNDNGICYYFQESHNKCRYCAGHSPAGYEGMFAVCKNQEARLKAIESFRKKINKWLDEQQAEIENGD